MKTTTRKRLSAAERRKKILSAAVSGFASDGYDNAKMDEIAIRAGISKPVLYDHFPSKEDLYLNVLQSIRDGLIAKGQSIAEEDVEPESKFRRGVDAFFWFVEQEPQASRVLLTTPSDPEAAEITALVQAGATAKLTYLLADFLPEMKGQPLEAATEFFKQGLHALALWSLDRPRMKRTEIVDIVMRVVWTGLEIGDTRPKLAGRRS